MRSRTLTTTSGVSAALAAITALTSAKVSGRPEKHERRPRLFEGEPPGPDYLVATLKASALRNFAQNMRDPLADPWDVGYLSITTGQHRQH